MNHHMLRRKKSFKPKPADSINVHQNNFVQIDHHYLILQEIA